MHLTREGAKVPGTPVLVDVFLDEYSRDDVIVKYLSDTAGTGIAHALTHVYGPIYRKVVKALVAQRPRGQAFRVLEYGCGGGMNLVKLVDIFREERAEIDRAIGADFSPRMVEAARQDAAQRFTPQLQQKIGFAVAANETLLRDLAKDLGVGDREITDSFDVVVGVNTFRYCHRLDRQVDCARDICSLLRPGGYSIMIDMNQQFPLFRSRLRDVFSGRSKREYYLPSLAEYTEPFTRVGFKILERRNFCWFPHSAGPALLGLLRVLAPVLDVCVPSFAMRSLVVAQKPS
jgi:SAM-dependent methyltransferase